MCTINKSAHTKKSGNLFNDPHTFHCYNLYGLMLSLHDTISTCPVCSPEISSIFYFSNLIWRNSDWNTMSIITSSCSRNTPSSSKTTATVAVTSTYNSFHTASHLGPQSAIAMYVPPQYGIMLMANLVQFSPVPLSSGEGSLCSLGSRSSNCNLTQLLTSLLTSPLLAYGATFHIRYNVLSTRTGCI